MTVHVVGAGLAGLSCALSLAERGTPVRLYEAAPQAGGRCRSFHDALLDATIDNGSHLILGANTATLNYVRRIGGALVSAPAVFPFIDENSSTWSIRPAHGVGPLWLLSPARRCPHGGLIDHLKAVRLSTASRRETVTACVGDTPLYAPLWRPLTEAILNTPPEGASARLLGRVLRLTMLRGAAACRPFLAPHGLGAALVEPALRRLAALGARTAFRRRLTGFETNAGRVAALAFDDETVAVGGTDTVVLAVPPWHAARLVDWLPNLPTSAIVNLHFRPERPVRLPADSPFAGLGGGLRPWLFARGPVLSATLSAADHLHDRPSDDLAAAVWADMARRLDLPTAVPPCRVVKERRATLSHSPATEALRPLAHTPHANLFLAGDWTATGLPCTIEGAIRSGETAAALAGKFRAVPG